MQSELKKNKKRNVFSASILAIGIVALTQGGISAAQADDITSVSSSNCSATAGYTVTLTGNFASNIYNVWANDYQVPLADWTQTNTSVVAKIPATSETTISMKTYNGGTILAKDFVCTGSVVVATPAAEDPIVTEEGGAIPATATNNYNTLAAGLVLVVVGGTVLYRRRLITE